MTNGAFLNCYELDELRERQADAKIDPHYPHWLEDDDSDDLIFNDALYGVV